MMEFLKTNQLNFMLVMSSVCGTIAVFVMIAKALPFKRRMALLSLELTAMFLLYFDRLAYMFSGDPTPYGFVMVRVTNFLVFSLTLGVIISLNFYISDLLTTEGGLESAPKRLYISLALAIIGIILIVISQFTGLYYYFDEANRYHRGPGFLLCYVFPLITPLVQLTVIVQNRERFNKGIYRSLILFIFAPIVASVIQIFAYGLSLTNMAMVGMGIVVYVYAIIDVNQKIERSKKREMDILKEERKKMQHLFEETSTAFINALDDKGEYSKGHSVRVARYARKIAQACGKNEAECDEVYYSGLLHDVGKIGLPEELLKKDELTEEEKIKMKEKPVIGDRILSGITDFPRLRFGAKYAFEKYDGTGYPDQLKGEEIPEVGRIIAVANYYDRITSQKSDRSPYPQMVVREEFVKKAGNDFDPRFAGAMVSLIDEDSDYLMQNSDENYRNEPDKFVEANAYRSSVSKGILIENISTVIRFKCKKREDSPTGFSAPSIILFDSYDGRVHDAKKNIDVFGYLEYGEIFFDGHVICTAARSMDVKVTERTVHTEEEIQEQLDSSKIEKNKKAESFILNKMESEYEIYTGRIEDHAKIIVKTPEKVIEVVAALPNSSKYAYVGLTGEYCTLDDIAIEKTIEKAYDEIPRIAPYVQYTNRMQSDIPNIQVDSTRLVYTRGIPLEDSLQIKFHTMSLPSANLIWHCPYIIIFHSDDGLVNGKNYKEYAFIKMSGENEGKYDYSENSIEVTRGEEFVNWEDWEECNREGVECEAVFEKKGKTIITQAENNGIGIVNKTRLFEADDEVYVALTGDQVALTDIRI
ncbi:MAG: HD domain-containing protein [Lachnospiraceae bacterium]|nr:HD domain-containing protein [Lachnospiraceae bacterium]